MLNSEVADVEGEFGGELDIGETRLTGLRDDDKTHTLTVTWSYSTPDDQGTLLRAILAWNTSLRFKI